MEQSRASLLEAFPLMNHEHHEQNGGTGSPQTPHCSAHSNGQGPSGTVTWAGFSRTTCLQIRTEFQAEICRSQSFTSLCKPHTLLSEEQN